MNDAVVSGTYHWLPSMKDQRRGDLKGIRKDGIITADYTFSQEGREETVAIEIVLQEDRAIISGGDPALGLNATLQKTDCNDPAISYLTEGTASPAADYNGDMAGLSEILPGQWKTTGNAGTEPNWLAFDRGSFYSWLDSGQKPSEISGTYKTMGDSLIELMYTEYNRPERYRIDSLSQDYIELVSTGVSAGSLVYTRTVYTK
jgi:hypothetical protein